jgi:hypothetical protein
MTRDKKLDAQMNLPLCQTPPIDLPQEKQRELAAALADLLWNAAVADDPSATRSTGDKQ